jgi:hypothetical protein
MIYIMRTLNGRARNVNSLINSSANTSCGGPSKTGLIQSAAYPRIAKGVMMARSPNQQVMTCAKNVGSRQYRRSAPMRLLG